jgi:FkbM family methyltransferase
MDSNLVFDVGLHKGEDSEFYLKKGFRVIAIDASPELCEFVRKAYRTYVQDGQLTVLNAAIAQEPGPTKFYKNERNSVWGTIEPCWAERNKRLGAESSEIIVNGIRFEQLLEEYGCPYYLKIDIEGADLLCIEGLRKFTERPQYISVESNKVSWSGLVQEFELLESLNYSKFKVVDQAQVENQQLPLPAREGKYVEHRFDFGSSGAFGEEAPGDWSTKAEALKKYRAIFWKYRLFGDFGTLVALRKEFARIPQLSPVCDSMEVGWYDTHASL